MNDHTFERSLELEVPAEEVFRWHCRPGAFERLVPPWEDVRLESAAAPIVPGARQVVSFPLGPLRMRWRSEIAAVEDGASFQDVQLSGPFAKWIHTHSMRPLGSGRSILEDHVRYALPMGPLGALAHGSVRARLERMFTYRHRVTLDDLDRHAAARSVGTLDVVVSGASGLVGKALCAFLSTGGHRVRRLVRGTPRRPDEFGWDPVTGRVEADALEGADAVVHLAGENIASRRWSRIQKDRIRRSRLDGTRHLADAVRAASNPPRIFVSASAIGIYGDRDDELLSEASVPGTGFLADVCRGWEARALDLASTRTVQLRFGMVLSPAGGALRKMLPPFRMGAGGRIGSGQQWMSWVALDDAVGAIHHALVDEELHGAVNVVAPGAVRNADFTSTLGRVLGRPTVVPLPAAVVRVAFGELGSDLLLASQRVLPGRLQETGFRFAFPALDDALRHQLGARQPA